MRTLLPDAAQQPVSVGTWIVASVILGSAVLVALVLPTWYGGCRPGWYVWEWHPTASPPYYCGRPPPEDDWGYNPHNLLVLKTAIGVGGVLLARAAILIDRRRHLAAAVMAVLAALAIGSTALLFLYPSAEERTGQIAATLRCPDPGCHGMTVEQAVMSERSESFHWRYPMAVRAWNAIGNESTKESSAIPESSPRSTDHASSSD